MICLIVSVMKTKQIVIMPGNLNGHSRSFTEPTSFIKLTPGAFFCRQVGPRFRKVAPRLKFLNFYLSPGAPSPTNNLSEKKNYFRRKVSYYDEKKKCLDPKVVVTTLTVKDTLYGKIGTILDSLVDKVEEDAKDPILSDEEMALIEYSSIPIIPLIQQELARAGDKTNIFLRNAEFIDVICYEVMSGFFEGILHKTLKEVRALEFAQVDSGKIERYLDTAQEVLSMLRHTKEHAYSRLVVIMQAKERLRQQEAEFDLIFEKLGA